jgi:hypothetical protein
MARGPDSALLDLAACNAYRTDLQVRSGGRGIRTHEEREPLAVFKTAAIGL